MADPTLPLGIVSKKLWELIPGHLNLNTNILGWVKFH